MISSTPRMHPSSKIDPSFTKMITMRSTRSITKLDTVDAVSPKTNTNNVSRQIHASPELLSRNLDRYSSRSKSDPSKLFFAALFASQALGGAQSADSPTRVQCRCKVHS